MTGERSVVRVIVVDDEPLPRDVLRTLLDADPEVELVAECTNGREALRALRVHRPDVVFLDVRMPGTDGLRVLSRIPPDERPAIVFTTAYDHYATRAFDEHAVDYLLKPFDDERFQLALGRAKERAAGGSHLGALEEPRPEPYTERLSIHRDGRIDLVDVADLTWIQAADQYVSLHTEEAEHLMRSSMRDLENALDPRRFFRAHRSAIVALDRVVRLESQSGGTGRVMLRGGEWIPVSRSRVSELRRRLAGPRR